jgi:hypothetical protein
VTVAAIDALIDRLCKEEHAVRPGKWTVTISRRDLLDLCVEKSYADLCSTVQLAYDERDHAYGQRDKLRADLDRLSSELARAREALGQIVNARGMDDLDDYYNFVDARARSALAGTELDRAPGREGQ